jgi:rhodanese-related sulfurtransferase
MRSGCQWVAALLLLAGCGGAPGGRSAGSGGGQALAVETAKPPGVGRLAAAEARGYLASHPGALVLDVRNPDEWNDDLGHIEGARLIPLPELSARMAEIEAWRDKPIVVVCRSGRRSQSAAERLLASGYREVMNLEGGMVAWRKTEP